MPRPDSSQRDQNKMLATKNMSLPVSVSGHDQKRDGRREGEFNLAVRQ